MAVSRIFFCFGNRSRKFKLGIDMEEYTKITANKVVSLLTEHRTLIQEELDDVLVGRRVLTRKTFLVQRKEKRRRNLTSENKEGATQLPRQIGKVRKITPILFRHDELQFLGVCLE